MDAREDKNAKAQRPMRDKYELMQANNEKKKEEEKKKGFCKK